MGEGYGEDLAYIHDAGFGETAEAASGFVIERLRSDGFAGGMVTDLGCGSGIMAAHLIEAGYSVFGVDISTAFIDLARRRVPGADFAVGSFLTVRIPPSVAITAVGEVLNYRFDENNEPVAWPALFKRCQEALWPGGFVLFDVAGPSRGSNATGGARTVSGDDWTVSAASTVDRAGRLLTRHIFSRRLVAGSMRSTEETHRLILAEPSEVLEALRSTGFETEVLQSYGPPSLPDGVSVFFARKSLPWRRTAVPGADQEETRGRPVPD